MRIIFFSDYFIPEIGAPAAHVYDRCRIWVEQGHEVTVITNTPNYPNGKPYNGYKNKFRYWEDIDGIKVRGSSNLPKGALEEVQVITGGLPANYGDVTGGIISITTRGPSANYFGSIEAVSSGIYINGEDPDGYDGKVIGLDKFGYNLFEGLLR